MAKRTDLHDRPTTVYWFFNRDEAIIYVGMTHKLSARLAAHRKKSWFSEVERIEVKELPNRIKAALAEEAMIRRFGPKYNRCATAKRARNRLRDPEIVEVPQLPSSTPVYGWTDFDPDTLPPAHWKKARGLFKGQNRGTVSRRRAVQARAVYEMDQQPPVFKPEPRPLSIVPEAVKPTRPPQPPRQVYEPNASVMAARRIGRSSM